MANIGNFKKTLTPASTAAAEKILDIIAFSILSLEGLSPLIFLARFK